MSTKILKHFSVFETEIFESTLLSPNEHPLQAVLKNS